MTQTFENHSRTVPLYHQVAFPILALNFFYSVYRAVRSFSLETAVGALVAVALLILFFYARIFALTVQDRVIRLEMTLRMERLLPTDLRGRVQEFTPGQLVALRFASDEELAELARKVLVENLQDRKVIKRMIKSWRPDFLRA